MNLILKTTLVLSACMALVGCSKEPDAETLARQEVRAVNIENAPKLTKEQQHMITESRGIIVSEEKNEEEEVIVTRNSFSPGEETVDILASMTREELLGLDAISHMEIFINGVIRDEYTVAAHTLYGEDTVKQFKREFKEGLLTKYPSLEEDERDPNMTYVDLIGVNTDLNDENVARDHTDVIISQLNRIFVKIIPQSDFGNRMTVQGTVYPVLLRNQLTEVVQASYGFTGIDGTTHDYKRTDAQRATLNTYYKETFPNALLKAPISEESSLTTNLGGFQQRDDGTWAPAKMPLFSWNLIGLIYGIQENVD